MSEKNLVSDLTKAIASMPTEEQFNARVAKLKAEREAREAAEREARKQALKDELAQLLANK